MRAVLSLASAALMLAPVCASNADEAIQTTTEFGITVAPDEIYDAIQETGDFWPAVRSYLTCEECTLEDPEICQQAANVIKDVNRHLYNRLFGGDDQSAYDLIDYVAARLRANLVRRRLREIMQDDAAFVQSKVHWEQAHRLRRRLPGIGTGNAEKVVTKMHGVMQSLGISAEKIDEAMIQWECLAQVEARRDSTEAGRQMLEFEREIIKGDQQLAELMRSIMTASDWAQITKPENHLVKRRDFVEACHELARLDTNDRTAQKPSIMAD